MPRCGVYQVLCKYNGHRYIGSAEDIDARWAAHKRELIRGKHVNKALQYAWVLFGESQFELSLIEETKPEDLQERENHYLHTLSPEFNILQKAGSRSPGREKKVPTCLRISESVLDQAKKTCKTEKMTMTALFETAIKEFLKNHGYNQIPVYTLAVTPVSYALIKKTGSKVEVIDQQIRNGVPIEEVRNSYAANLGSMVDIEEVKPND